MTRNADETVRKEAERWFARLREPTVSDAERETFERWRAQDPGRAEAYAATQRLWDKLEVLKGSERLRRAVTKGAASSGFLACAWERTGIRYSAIAALAASAVAVTTLGLFSLNRDAASRTFETALGEQRTEHLADGSTLRLNTDSTIQVRITRHGRTITLRKGEAAFDVAKDRIRPFVVTAGDGTVTAVGTRFEVRRDASFVQVTLIEGRVQLARPSRQEVQWLDPGQQAAFSDDASGIVTRNVDVGVLTSWMSGRLEFRDTPLRRAVAEANRYSVRKLRIGDPAIQGLPVSGTFRTGDIDAMAVAFEAAFAVRAKTGGTDVVLYGR